MQQARTNQLPSSDIRQDRTPGHKRSTLDPNVHTGEKIAKEEAVSTQSCGAPPPPPTTNNAGSPNEDTIDDEEWLDMEQREVSSTLAVQGSEDFLVPNSPESRDDDVKGGTKLDLGRFAFTGQD